MKVKSQIKLIYRVTLDTDIIDEKEQNGYSGDEIMADLKKQGISSRYVENAEVDEVEAIET